MKDQGQEDDIFDLRQVGLWAQSGVAVQGPVKVSVSHKLICYLHFTYPEPKVLELFF